MSLSWLPSTHSRRPTSSTTAPPPATRTSTGRSARIPDRCFGVITQFRSSNYQWSHNMSLTSLFRQLSQLASRRAMRRSMSCGQHQARPTLELLEGRLCPSGSYLLVGSFNNNSVLRYDESTGAFVDQFDPHNLANLKTPVGGVFGPDGNLYVTSGVFLKNNQSVLQYNGTTGAFQSVFASQNVTSPRGVLFGPDGNLYVLDGNDNTSGDPASVERFDGKTRAFLNYFVAPSSGGLTHPSYMVF